MLNINYHMCLKKWDWNYRSVLNILLILFLTKKKFKISALNKKVAKRFMILRSPFHYKYSKSILEDANSVLVFRFQIFKESKIVSGFTKEKFNLFSGLFLLKTDYTKRILI